METTMARTESGVAYEIVGGAGPTVLAVPGAGDLRSEYRTLGPRLVDAGLRVVTMDLPGHGDSSPGDEYSVAATSSALAEVISAVGGGPVIVVATSFAPAAAVWLAAERPDLIAGIVAISPHLEADGGLKARLERLAIELGLRGPWAGALWGSLYRSWYVSDPPADLAAEVARLRDMVGDPERRRAVRETLTADRDGVDQRIERVSTPTLTIFGSADSHFSDPAAEAVHVSRALRGRHVVVDGAGHYPHVEQPDFVAAAVVEFATTV